MAYDGAPMALLACLLPPIFSTMPFGNPIEIKTLSTDMILKEKKKKKTKREKSYEQM